MQMSLVIILGIISHLELKVKLASSTQKVPVQSVVLIH